MNIDRTRFLWLTASLASSTSCSGSTPTGPRSQVAESQSEITVPEANESEELPPAPSRAQACHDDRGSKLDCSGIRAPGGWCEGFDYVVAECKSAHEHLPGAVAQALQRCLIAASGTQAVCNGPLDRCYERALERACPPPKYAKLCSDIASGCGQPEMKQVCQKTFGLFRSSAYPKTAECQVEHCLRNNCKPEYCRGRWLAHPTSEGACAGIEGEMPEPSHEG